MKKKFYADVLVAYTSIICLTPGFIMMSTALVGHNTNLKLAAGIFLGIIVLTFLWLGLAKGTYITVTEKEVRGRVLFIPGKKSVLATVKALKTQGSFGGVITQIYLVYEDTKAGKKLPDRGLTSKSMLPKKDLQELLRTIHQTNPHIEIPEELLKLI